MVSKSQLVNFPTVGLQIKFLLDGRLLIFWRRFNSNGMELHIH